MRSIERTRILHNAPPPCGEHHPFFTFNCVFCQKLIVLNIQLFGSPVAYDSDEQQHLPLTKPALLLFYLAYYGQWMTREELAFFFRPEADESTARSYVRKLLNSAKKMPWAQGLEIESERLRWQVDTDIARFLDAFHNGRWYEAIEYYNGDFLKGVTDVGLLSYDAWIDTEREALANKWHTAVLNYANDLEASEQHLEAADTVKRILNQDEFAEDALRVYIKNLYLGGRREQALKESDTFYNLLLSEMGLEPDAETQRLVEQIRAAQSLPRAVSSRKYGRRAEDRANSNRDTSNRDTNNRDTQNNEFTVNTEKTPQRQTRQHETTEHLQAILGNSNVSMNIVGDNDQQCTLVVTMHADVTTTYDTLLALAENSISASEYTRALHLLSMVMPSRCSEAARAKYDILWENIKKFVPEEVLKFHRQITA